MSSLLSGGPLYKKIDNNNLENRMEVWYPMAGSTDSPTDNIK